MPAQEKDIGDLPHQGTPLLNGPPRLQIETTSLNLARSRRLLYLSHFFNQFSENSWQFCLVLFLAAFSNYQSLILVSSYGLVSTASVCYFGSATGRFIDGTNRLIVARQFIGYENCAVLLATACCYLLLSRPQEEEYDKGENNSEWSRLRGVPTDSRSLFLLVSVHLLGAAAKMFDTGFMVAVERDWIVVMSTCIDCIGLDDLERLAKQKAWLSDTNVAMKQIDLGCQVVAPAIAGIFVAVFDDGTNENRGSNLVGAAIFVGLLNATALVVEYICTSKIYHDIPPLAFKRVPSTLNKNTNYILPVDSDNHEKPSSSLQKVPIFFLPIPEWVRVYMDQDVSWAGIGLSLL